MRFGQQVWHAKRKDIENATKPTFHEKTAHRTRPNYLSVMQASTRGSMEVMKYGEDLFSTWVVIARRVYFDGKFKEGDVMWVDGETPNEDLEQKYGCGCTANAVVKSVSVVDQTISIVLSRNKNKVTK